MLILKEYVYFDMPQMSKMDAIRLAGEKLVEHEFVTPEYVLSMIEKEKTDVTYIGNGIAIPHGKLEAKKYVKKSGIVVLHFRDGIMYDEEKANIVIGIAATKDDHIDMLTEIAIKLSDEDVVLKLVNSDSLDDFILEFNA